MEMEEAKRLITNYINTYNCFDIEGMLACLHENITFQNISAEEVNASTVGKEEFRALAEQAKPMFSVREQTIKSFTFDFNKASVEIAFKANLSVDLPNGLKAGQDLNINGQSEFEFKDGYIFSIKDFS